MKFITSALTLAVSMEANPIRKVVTMLQNIEKEIEAETEKEEDNHAKFMCYCKTNTGTLEDSIKAAQDKLDLLKSKIEELSSSKKSTDEEIVQHKEDRTSAKETIASANEQRLKEEKAFEALHSEQSGQIAAMAGAVKALESGMGKSFLQSNMVSSMGAALSKSSIDSDDRSLVESFLSGPSASYSSQSGEIVGIIKTMLEEFQKDDQEAIETEDASIETHAALIAAKNKEIAAAGAAVEAKITRSGKLAVDIVNAKNDLKDTTESLGEDIEFALELKNTCATRGDDYEARKSERAQEEIAIAETIKVLNDDDAMELFTKAAPKAFIQVQGESLERRRERATNMVTSLKESYNNNDLNFLAVALHGKGGFDKVVEMIDNMVATLKTEQIDDEKHETWCHTEFDTSDDKRKSHIRRNASLEESIQEANDSVATLVEELAALHAAVEKLDLQVTVASAQRKSENSEFSQSEAENSAAVKILDFAKNRLNKFYNPAQYKAPPPRELTEEERIFQANGGKLEPVPVTGIAGTGIAVGGFVQVDEFKVAPPAAPKAGSFKKNEKSGGVIEMINMLVNDIKKESTIAQTEEKNAQEDYEKMMDQSQKKRKNDSKSIVTKDGAKADMESDLADNQESLKDNGAELMSVNKYISELHGSCDFIIENSAFRKTARTQEVEALVRAKAVLNGADYSFVQIKSHLRRA